MKDVDYSKFKKIKQDKESATLKHPDGHMIRMALGGLSPSMRKKIDKLPLYASEGTDPIEKPEPPEKEETEPPIVGEVPQTSGPEGAPPTPPPAAPPSGAPPNPSAAPNSSQAQADSDAAALANMPANAPSQETSDVTSPPTSAGNPVVMPPVPDIPLTPDQELAKHNTEDMLYAHDLAQGKIQPKTYQSLYNDKNLPGKLSTLFGLLVSGAGSGLAHQSNAVLDMMNKEIDRDLDAQKNNQTNAQNWFRASMEHRKNEVANNYTNALSAKTGADTAAVQAGIGATTTQTYNNALDAARKNYFLHQDPDYVEDDATLAARNKMLITAAHGLQTVTNNMPDSQGKVIAQHQIATNINPTVGQAVQNNNLKRVQNAEEAKKNLPPQTNQEESKVAEDLLDPRVAPAFDNDKYQAGIKKGIRQNNLGGKIYGAIDEPTTREIDEQKQKVEFNRNNAKKFINSFYKLDSLGKLAGQEPVTGVLGEAVPKSLSGAGDALHEAFENERNSLIEGFKQTIGNAWSEERVNKFIAAHFPTWNDRPGNRAEKFNQGIEYFKGQPEEFSGAASRFGLINPFPDIKFHSHYKDTQVKGASPSAPAKPPRGQ